MDLQLRDRVYLVAAGSRGLGYAIGRQLALAGARVVLGSRNIEDVEAAARRLCEECGSVVSGASLDMSDAQSIQRWVAEAEERFGRIDGVLVNAGGPPPGGFDDFDDAAWQAAFELTLMSAVRLVREALPALRRSDAASILMLTSSSVKEPIDILLLSNVMRSGVSSLAKSLSRSLAAEGIRVNNLIPGQIYTDRIKALDAKLAETNGVDVSEQRASNESLIPLGRYGDPEEFGKAGAFLLSPAASYITGASLVVDGGTMKSLF
ncbi:SDR family oxidoreductase [Spongiibacter tropicus]|uniref:SDR family oxidoreductase n=1 Tax=Spongiibacter tropicus TaxID=454602 RepID=UPI0003B55C40|nr:SDR family oxidoreductase [Spongiibacter tropicus]